MLVSIELVVGVLGLWLSHAADKMDAELVREFRGLLNWVNLSDSTHPTDLLQCMAALDKHLEVIRSGALCLWQRLMKRVLE